MIVYAYHTREIRHFTVRDCTLSTAIELERKRYTLLEEVAIASTTIQKPAETEVEQETMAAGNTECNPTPISRAGTAVCYTPGIFRCIFHATRGPRSHSRNQHWKCSPYTSTSSTDSTHASPGSSKLLNDMLQRDVIRPSTSPWASRIVLVCNRDGSTCFCVDYRKVNNVTRKDAYPLPQVDDTLAGAKWFSTPNLTIGYWQVEVEPRDHEKTVFCTPDGLLKFSVMPFCLCNAPATFQHLMDLVLAGLQWWSCLVYLDDIIIISQTSRNILQTCRQY